MPPRTLSSDGASTTVISSALLLRNSRGIMYAARFPVIRLDLVLEILQVLDIYGRQYGNPRIEQLFHVLPSMRVLAVRRIVVCQAIDQDDLRAAIRLPDGDRSLPHNRSRLWGSLPVDQQSPGRLAGSRTVTRKQPRLRRARDDGELRPASEMIYRLRWHSQETPSASHAAFGVPLVQFPPAIHPEYGGASHRAFVRILSSSVDGKARSMGDEPQSSTSSRFPGRFR